MKDITVTINETIWQNRLDRINAENRTQHEAEQAAKPEAERVPFVPVTLKGYFTARVGDIEQSYARQIAEESANVLQAPEVQEVLADPVQANRLIKALVNPDLRQQLSDIIDAS